MYVHKKELGDSMCVRDENIWETGGESVMDEGVCETEACDENVWERESRSLDENVKLPDIKRYAICLPGHSHHSLTYTGSSRGPHQT